MGVDITFKKMNRDRAKELISKCGAPNFFDDHEIPDDFSWENFCAFTEKDELMYCCGRHLIYDAILAYPGDCLKVPSRTDLEELHTKCLDVVNKYRVHYDELLTVPVDLLKKYVEEAEKNDEPLVTFPIEDKSDWDYSVDEWDYYQARNFLEDVWPHVENLDESEMILVDFSY